MDEGKKKKTSTKKKKERADKYEDKVSFEGTFDELLELTLKPRTDKEEGKKKDEQEDKPE